MRFEKLVVCLLIYGLFVLTMDVSNVVAQDQLDAGQADKHPAQVKSWLQVDSLAGLPEQLGVAGPIVGYHDEHKKGTEHKKNTKRTQKEHKKGTGLIDFNLPIDSSRN